MQAMILALAILAAQAAPAGKQTFVEYGFVFTQEEAEVTRCKSPLSMVKTLQRIRAPQDQIMPEFEVFKRCVLDIREARKYEAEVDERRAKERAEVQAKREAAEEAQRKREAERKADDEMIAKLLLTNKKVVSILLSSSLCWCTHERAAVLAQIAKDKKYSRVGGVVDLGKRAELQQRLEEIDDWADAIKTRMKAKKVAQMPCNDGDVQALEPCLDPDVPVEKCSDEDPKMERTLRVMVRAARKLISEDR